MTTVPAPSTTRGVHITSTTTLPRVSGAPYDVAVEERAWARGARALPTRVYLPRAAGQFPVFVWAHGFQATVDYFDAMLRAFARHGYVVVAPTFPLTHTGAPGGGTYNDYVNQPADVSFVISHVLAAYAGHVDPARIAVGGHSLGAVTAMALTANRCCVDARVHAVVAVDGSNLAFPNGASDERGIPLLLIHGDADRTFAVNESRAIYARAHAPKYLVVLHGIAHTPFRTPRAVAVIDPTILDFLDATFSRDAGAGARLARDASVPGFSTLAAQR